MKDAINKMMAQNVARKFSNDNNFNYEFYLHVYVIMYAKIALYHSIDLEINYEVTPKELIGNTLLESYEDPYDFMKDFDLATVTPKDEEARDKAEATMKKALERMKKLEDYSRRGKGQQGKGGGNKK